MPGELIRVFDREPDLLPQLLPRRTREAVRLAAVVPVQRLSSGDWLPPLLRSAPSTLGFLLLDGLILRRVAVGELDAVEILGEGDVMLPWTSEQQETLVETHDAIRVCTPTAVAVLDGEFQSTVSAHPEIMSSLMERVARRAVASSTQRAIVRQPHLDARLLLMLWHLAERWGRVDRDGVVLDLPLTQSVLADLVSARRTSVNVALARLYREGSVLRVGTGRYRLFGDPPANLRELEEHFASA